MTQLLTEYNRDKYLTARWNNVLVLVLGVPTLLFAYIALVGGAFSDFTAFVGLVVVSAFY